MPWSLGPQQGLPCSPPLWVITPTHGPSFPRAAGPSRHREVSGVERQSGPTSLQAALRPCELCQLPLATTVLHNKLPQTQRLRAAGIYRPAHRSMGQLEGLFRASGLGEPAGILLPMFLVFLKQPTTQDAVLLAEVALVQKRGRETHRASPVQAQTWVPGQHKGQSWLDGAEDYTPPAPHGRGCRVTGKGHGDGRDGPRGTIMYRPPQLCHPHRGSLGRPVSEVPLTVLCARLMRGLWVTLPQEAQGRLLNPPGETRAPAFPS